MRSRIAYLIFIVILGVLAYIGFQADHKREKGDVRAERA
jgi:hypothetical protein